VPLYEYKCVKCNRRTEKIESVNGPHLKKCPHCGGKVEPIISAPAIQFKGSGWYVTDYAGKKPASEPGKSDTSSDNKDSSDSGSKDSTPKESASKDSKDSSSKESKETKKEKPAKK